MMELNPMLRTCLETGTDYIYEDDTDFYVRKSDFDRAFGCIVSGEKNAIINDFSIN